MSNVLPWFKVEVLQVANDLSDVKSLEGEGAYFRVLRHLWLNGPQPIEQLRRKCQQAFNELEHLFINCSTGAEQLFSVEWLERQRAAADAWRDKKSKAGTESARVRASKSRTKNRRSTAVEQPTSSSTVLDSSEKERASESSELTWPAWGGPKCRAKWSEYIAYRQREHKARYKSIETEQKALDLACLYFPAGPMFVEGIEHTMAKNWKAPVDPAEHKYPFTEQAKPEPVSTGWNPRA